MIKKRSGVDVTESEKCPAAEPAAATFTLTLFIAGHTRKAVRAIANVKIICDEYLPGHYELEVIDISQAPDLARGEGIVASPTLIKKLPLPLRRVIGDMSHKDKLLTAIDIRIKP